MNTPTSAYEQMFGRPATSHSHPATHPLWMTWTDAVSCPVCKGTSFFDEIDNSHSPILATMNTQTYVGRVAMDSASIDHATPDVFDIGKSDGLMDEPKMSRATVARISPDPAAHGVYLAGYRAGVKEDGR